MSNEQKELYDKAKAFMLRQSWFKKSLNKADKVVYKANGKDHKKIKLLIGEALAGSDLPLVKRRDVSVELMRYFVVVVI